VETLIINKKSNLRYGVWGKRIFSVFFILFLFIGVRLIIESMSFGGSSASIVLIIFGIIFLSVIVFFVMMFFKAQSNLLVNMEVQPEQINFEMQGRSLSITKNYLNAIIIEQQVLDNFKRTSFKFLIKTFPNDKNLFWKDENNLSYNNEDINDTANGQEVLRHIEFYKKYYGDCLIIKNL